MVLGPPITSDYNSNIWGFLQQMNVFKDTFAFTIHQNTELIKNSII